MSLFDRIKQRLGLGASVDEVVREVEDEDEIGIPATREYVRAVRRSQRLKGPGWTRPMRKGRTQRG